MALPPQGGGGAVLICNIILTKQGIIFLSSQRLIQRVYMALLRCRISNPVNFKTFIETTGKKTTTNKEADLGPWS